MRSLMAAAAVIVATGLPALAQDAGLFEALGRKLETAISNKQASEAAALFTEDAVLLPPGSERISGRAAIEQFWTLASAGIDIIDFTTVSVTPLGEDSVLEIGTLILKVDDDQQPGDGKYIKVWRRDGEAWSIAAGAWNMN